MLIRFHDTVVTILNKQNGPMSLGRSRMSFQFINYQHIPVQDWWGHSGLYSVLEGGNGAAADGWSVVISHLIGGNNLWWDCLKKTIVKSDISKMIETGILGKSPPAISKRINSFHETLAFYVHIHTWRKRRHMVFQNVNVSMTTFSLCFLGFVGFRRNGDTASSFLPKLSKTDHFWLI